MIGRLVQQEDIGILCKDLGKKGPLRLTPGKGPERLMAQGIHAGELQGLADLLIGGGGT